MSLIAQGACILIQWHQLVTFFLNWWEWFFKEIFDSIFQAQTMFSPNVVPSKHHKLYQIDVVKAGIFFLMQGNYSTPHPDFKEKETLGRLLHLFVGGNNLWLLVCCPSNQDPFGKAVSIKGKNFIYYTGENMFDRVASHGSVPIPHYIFYRW